MAGIGKFVVGLMVALFGGYIFMSGWNWFVAPLGVVEIGVFHAYGLWMMGNFVAAMPQINMKMDEYFEDAGMKATSGLKSVIRLILYGVILLVLWITAGLAGL